MYCRSSHIKANHWNTQLVPWEGCCLYSYIFIKRVQSVLNMFHFISWAFLFLTPVQASKIFFLKKIIKCHLWCRKWNTYSQLIGSQTGAPTMENTANVSQKTRNISTMSYTTIGHSLKELCATIVIPSCPCSLLVYLQ